MRTPSRLAPSRYCSIANAGSTTIASPASTSPTRYEPQPRSSSTNCRKSTERSLARQAEVTRDHHPLHLVRALADLEDLLVAVEARDGELVHEAVAAVDLERPVRGAMRELAGEELRHRGGAGEVAPGVLLPGGLVHEMARGLDLRRHVDELRLHGLERRD